MFPVVYDLSLLTSIVHTFTITYSVLGLVALRAHPSRNVVYASTYILYLSLAPSNLCARHNVSRVLASDMVGGRQAGFETIRRFVCRAPIQSIKFGKVGHRALQVLDTLPPALYPRIPFFLCLFSVLSRTNG